MFHGQDPLNLRTLGRAVIWHLLSQISRVCALRSAEPYGGVTQGKHRPHSIPQHRTGQVSEPMGHKGDSAGKLTADQKSSH